MLERLRDDAAALPDSEHDAADRVVRRLDADWHAAAYAHDRATRRIRATPRCAHRSRPRPTRPRLHAAGRIRTRLRRLPGRASTRGGSCGEAVDDLGATPPDAALHAVRIRAKRCRYAAEATIPVFGTPAQRFARAIADVQDVLGEHQDAVVAARGSRRPRASARRPRRTRPGCWPSSSTSRGRAPARAFPERGTGARAPQAAALAVSRTSTVEAAGGVVLRGRRRAALEVLVVHRPKYDDWSLPKGKLEPGETPRGRRGPRGRGGDRLAVRRSARSSPPCATPTGTAARSTSVTGT